MGRFCWTRKTLRSHWSQSLLYIAPQIQGMKSIRYIQTLGSFKNYYRSMNEILANAFGKTQMLHYPFYMKDPYSLTRYRLRSSKRQ